MSSGPNHARAEMFFLAIIKTQEERVNLCQQIIYFDHFFISLTPTKINLDHKY